MARPLLEVRPAYPASLLFAIHVQSRAHAAVINAIVNSSLFFLYFATFSDGYHLSSLLASDFPLVIETLDDEKLIALGERLRVNLVSNASEKQIATRIGDVIEYAALNASVSKPVIDEIDEALARHYGFTDEELDFIINYDIKYRMGDDLGEDGDEGEE